MKAAVALFLVASLFGLTMRFMFVGELPGLNYKHLLHAHSHIALMGWAYMLVSGALLFLFIGATRHSAFFKAIFVTNVVASIGMAVAFPLQGYGAISIGFSTLHLFAVYGFSYQFLKELRRNNQNDATKLARWSVYWLLISTIGLWAVGPVGAMLGRQHPVFYMCIQFFLHFQLNGWLTFAVLSLILQHAQRSDPSARIPSHAFWMLQLSLLLTYTLSVTWSNPIPALFYINSIGVVLQSIAFALILWPLRKVENLAMVASDWRQWLLLAGVACLLLKVLVHVAVALPMVASISYTIKNFVIGFIHLVVVGSVTLSVAGILLQRGLLPSDGITGIGWQLLLAAFILTEILLMGQGLLLWFEVGFIPNYHLFLFAASALFPIALSVILSGFWRHSPSAITTSIPINQSITNQIQSS
jgi:hypothetical protein